MLPWDTAAAANSIAGDTAATVRVLLLPGVACFPRVLVCLPAVAGLPGVVAVCLPGVVAVCLPGVVVVCLPGVVAVCLPGVVAVCLPEVVPCFLRGEGAEGGGGGGADGVTAAELISFTGWLEEDDSAAILARMLATTAAWEVRV